MFFFQCMFVSFVFPFLPLCVMNDNYELFLSDLVFFQCTCAFSLKSYQKQAVLYHVQQLY